MADPVELDGESAPCREPFAFNNLAVCAGVGMLDEGLHIATGSRTVCYIEREAGAAAILLARMADAALEPAPVFCDDLERFDGKPWRGRVDSVSAGFPCQPWSQAGKQQGTADERWIWPEIARIIGEVGPWFVFLENVPGLLIQQRDGAGIAHVLGSLADLGFAAQWGSLRASDVGAAHQCERVFVLAVSERNGYEPWRLHAGFRRSIETAAEFERTGAPLADAGGGQFPQPQRGTDRGDGIGPAGADVADAAQRGFGDVRQPSGRGGLSDRHDAQLADAARAGSQGNRHGEPERRDEFEPCGADGRIFAPGPADPAWRTILDRMPWLAPAVASGTETTPEPGVCGVADGLAVVVDESRADQLRAIGNGVVPLQAAVAFVVLARRIVD